MANVFGTDNPETLNAFDGVTSGADSIFGFGGDDDIFGLGGNDEIKGGGGADALSGGSGIDTANYSDSAVGVTVGLATGQGFGGTAEGDTLTSIENLTGSAHGDLLVGDDGVNILTGLEDDDILKGGGGADTLYGDSGSDTLKGGGGADTLNGGSGFDTAAYNDSDTGVFVSLLNDAAAGGDAEGDELNSIENVTGSAHADNLWGNDGVNRLNGLDGDDSLKGFGGADELLGGEGDDNLLGMDGSDTLDGGSGVNTLDGGAGNDIYQVDNATTSTVEAAAAGDDHVYASVSHGLQDNVERLYLEGSAFSGVGNDGDNVITGTGLANDLRGRPGDDYLVGAGGDDALRGDTGLDQLHGGDGDDQLSGGSKDDMLFGGDGDDGLAGGGDKDTLWGGAGRDAFAFYAPEETGSGGGDRDVVMDFNSANEDWLFLAYMDADATQSGDQAFTWVGGSAVFSGSPGELHYFHIGQVSYVEGDVDGDGNDDFQIELAGKLSLGSEDFFL